MDSRTKPPASVNSRLYRVGPGAVDPDGIGEGISLALPCVLGGFLFAVPPVVAAVLLVWVVPDCSQDVRNAMPIRTAIREISCFFIGYNLLRAAQGLWSS